MNNNKIKNLCFAGITAALVFVFTFTFKIPVGTMGYAHLGDAFIILTTWLLTGKRSGLAAALGAALADLVSGYAVWIIPTFIIKLAMVIVFSLIAERIFKEKLYGYVIGAVAGAIVHIAGYSLAWYIIGGTAGIAAGFLPLVIQTVIGMVAGLVLIFLLSSNGIGRKLKSMTK